MTALVIAIVATLVIVLLVLNLGVGENKVEYQIDAFYPVEDPQFVHVMGVLLGPPVVAGNRFHALFNSSRTRI